MEYEEYYKEEFVLEYNQVVKRLTILTLIIRQYKNWELAFKVKCPIKLLIRERNILIDYVDVLIKIAKIKGIDIDKQEYWNLFKHNIILD